MGLILSKGVALAVTQIPQSRYSNAINGSKNEKNPADVGQAGFL